MKNTAIVLICLMAQANGFAQKDTTAFSKRKIYNMHPAYQLPAAGAFILLSTMGFHKLDNNANMTVADVMKLDPNTINALDRSTATRNPAGFAKAEHTADVLLNVSVVSPVILALDKNIRKDWIDLITLYMGAQAFDNVLYFSSIAAVRRPRPRAYNTALPMSERTGIGMSKSFFSGHVSFSATATFFAAKVYTDYHQIKGFKRILFYTAASVPPLLTGYFRIEAGKHFKTDVIAGFLAGATSGILVPELFRIKNKQKSRAFSFSPYYVPNGGGATMTMILN